MSLVWLRVALVLYSVGLAHAVVTLFTRRVRLFPQATAAFALGAVFHLVAVVEDAAAVGQFPAGSFDQSVSFLALVIACVYLLVYWRYRFEALSLFVFPLVFMMALAAALGTPARLENPVLRSSWVYFHVTLVFAGYAMLFVTFAAGLLYLLQERELKAKNPRAMFSRLPPLEQLDDVARKTLALGFTCMTLGIISGGVLAAAEWGSRWPLDPKIAMAFVTWFIYLALIFTRWTAGWRGRKAAYFAIAGFVAVIATWGAEGGLHSFK